MQEFGSDGGVGRVFGAAELRMPMGYVAAAPLPHPHPHPHLQLQPPPPPPPPPPPQIKCPRCESTNTKFCYYNNYNLSQPRHFCKSCRRYWTKGGVLRNVPVGGGCRKSKRASSKPSSSSSSSSPSKPSSSSPSSSSAAPAAVAASDKDHRPRPPSSASRSSSDSSTLTAAADHPSSSNPNPNPFETLPQAPRIFPEPSGTFANLMSAGSGVLDLGFPHPPPAPAPLQSQQSKSAAEEAIGAQQGFADQTVGMDLTPPFQGRSNGGGGLTLNGLDWPGTVEPTLFDLSGAVDHWNPSHWGDTDPSLYLP